MTVAVFRFRYPQVLEADVVLQITGFMVAPQLAADESRTAHGPATAAFQQNAKVQGQPHQAHLNSEQFGSRANQFAKNCEHGWESE